MTPKIEGFPPPFAPIMTLSGGNGVESAKKTTVVRNGHCAVMNQPSLESM
jgi:hypothetical protein